MSNPVQNELSPHPHAELFPMLSSDAFEGLVDDIRTNGLLMPIVLHGGKILDGRNRYAACLEAGVAPRFEKYSGSDPLGFAISANMQRRHLDESQRAMVAAKIATLKHGQRSDLVEETSIEASARMLNVGVASVERARTVRRSGSADLIRAVEEGVISVSKAAMLATETKDQQRSVVKKVRGGMKTTEALREMRREQLPAKVAALPSGKYRVIYCDPPWQYNDARQTGDHWQTTGALHHYSTMTLEQLEALDVEGLAADDCVLLMWATCPLLPDALSLMRTWGFKYKQFFIWDKGHGAFGSYHDAEAEVLLIGTMGACTPEIDTKAKQIQRFKREKQHSRKPEEWRALIDELWPSGARVELFRRGNVPAGWKTWGAEAEAEAAA